MQDRTDEELLQEVRACADVSVQRALLNDLFTRYHTRIALWCYRVTGDRESAADLAQDVLTRAYQNLDSFRGESKFSTWLFTITRNHCFNAVRQKAAVREDPIDPVELDAATEDRFDLRLEQAEDLRAMRSLLTRTLDETEQRIMTLHYGEELPLDAVTRLLGLVNPSGARAHIVSARRKLKAAVERLRRRQSPGSSQ